jgi:hypothetical protein
MKKLLIIAALFICGGFYVYRDGNGVLQTFNDFACLTTQHCSAQVITDSSGTEKATNANPLIVVPPANVTPSNCSISLTLGGTAQNIIAASTSLNGFTIANIDPITGGGEPIWLSFTGAAVAGATGSFPLASPSFGSTPAYANLASYTTPANFRTNGAVSVIAATTSHKVSCVQW